MFFQQDPRDDSHNIEEAANQSAEQCNSGLRGIGGTGSHSLEYALRVWEVCKCASFIFSQRQEWLEIALRQEVTCVAAEAGVFCGLHPMKQLIT